VRQLGCPWRWCVQMFLQFAWFFFLLNSSKRRKKVAEGPLFEIEVDTISGVQIGVDTLQVVFW
jgi:hypothetical protein